MDLKEAIEAVRPAVVQIDDRDGNVIGSGFFVDDKAHVATAWHVVEDLPAPTVALAHPNTEDVRANFRGIGTVVVAKDEHHDLAVLEMARNPFDGEMHSAIVIGEEEIDLLYGTVHLDATRPDDGEPIAISGYPLENPVLVTTSGAIAAAWNWDTHDVRTPSGVTFPEMSDVYLADVQANPGNSGGPAYRISDGAIIGVCIRVQGAPTWDETGADSDFAANAGLTEIRPVRYLVSLIAAVARPR